ncbi:MAG: GrpB family protein [Anaerolineae bacterium]|nr:GrpB family protein [Anaerolineae bacterium]
MSSGYLQIVGGQQVLANDGPVDAMLGFYGRLFDRLTVEVQHMGEQTRYVGYQCVLGGKDTLHFFGIEVDQVEAIPDGMFAWALGDDTWAVWQARDGHDEIVAQEALTWRWLEPAPDSSLSDAPRYCGEFAARLPALPNLPASPSAREFWLSAHAYVSLDAAAADSDEVRLVPYDPSWPRQFAEFAGWLEARLGADLALRIEHYGSTAIPGMPAKPIIDVLVQVPSFAQARRWLVPCFNNELWEYWWYAEHITLIKRDRLMGRRTHHVHVAPEGHRVWDGLVFRDYLRAHPHEAAAYGALKSELAASLGQERERYTEAKTAFIRQVVAKAQEAQR